MVLNAFATPVGRIERTNARSVVTFWRLSRSVAHEQQGTLGAAAPLRRQ